MLCSAVHSLNALSHINFIPSALYKTPNSSSTAFWRSSSVTSVLQISSLGFSGCCKLKRRKESMSRLLREDAKRKAENSLPNSASDESARMACRAADLPMSR